MIEREKFAEAARAIKGYFSAVDPEEFEAGTGIDERDFCEIVPRDFDGQIFAIDGSNVVVFDLGAVSLNRIRAGYVVYRGREWQKTVVTYDDLFTADRENYPSHFDRYRRGIFGLEEPFELKTPQELDRISTFFRDLQEHVALYQAVSEAAAGDVVLYDGGFSLWSDPYYREVLNRIFEEAEEREADLLAVSKSSKLSWGRGIARPLIRSVDRVGSRILPESPWRVLLTGKKAVKEEAWRGKTYAAKFHPRSSHAFRVDAPDRAAERIDEILGRVAMYARSSESLGYPHALFRAHQDLKIPVQERNFTRLSLFEDLRAEGLNEREIQGALDYHEILDGLSRR
ncbi:DNA double-strand break repair nuclease NurA [Methanocrinis sp.]|uniref:DNA double-strand break repair nuclease NurA n=1 Tax=Methanocrinis sp. TaxID=3101522 RepID=UPI003D0D022A